jgi:hypothetical protein
MGEHLALISPIDWGNIVVDMMRVMTLGMARL